jgi:uncharacterized protein YndB with AHSA1/START domain
VISDLQLASADPALDLAIERTIHLPASRIWAAWTVPERLVRWFAPRPWTTVACDIDLRPGGAFRTVMRSPDGQDYPNVGCYLAVEPDALLVWTSALGAGFRPNPATPGGFPMTVLVTLTSEGPATHYSARVLHADAEGRARHEAMGFRTGWNAALDQLIEACRDA